MPGQVIIIGTGQIGIASAQYFADQGWRAKLIGRTPVHPGLADIDFEIADREDFAELQQAVGAGADLLIDTIAFDRRDSEQLVRLSDRLGAIAAISSASVYCDAKGRTLDEASVKGFPSDMDGLTETHTTVEAGAETYSTRKVAMELALLDGAENKAIIVRPCAIHGAHSRHPREWWFVKRMLDGRRKIPLVDSGANQFQTTSVASIARLVFDLAGSEHRGCYNCADADSPTVKAIGAAIAAKLGTQVEFFGTPSNNMMVGRTPWSVPKPFTTSNAKAQQAGVGRFECYYDEVNSAAEWLTAIDKADWEKQLPQLAAYPWNLFDYAAEDAVLSGDVVPI
jgi:nucleoside-diphosphate-sugar epimerase